MSPKYKNGLINKATIITHKNKMKDVHNNERNHSMS